MPLKQTTTPPAASPSGSPAGITADHVAVSPAPTRFKKSCPPKTSSKPPQEPRFEHHIDVLVQLFFGVLPLVLLPRVGQEQPVILARTNPALVAEHDGEVPGLHGPVESLLGLGQLRLGVALDELRIREVRVLRLLVQILGNVFGQNEAEAREVLGGAIRLGRCVRALPRRLKGGRARGVEDGYRTAPCPLKAALRRRHAAP